MVRRVLAAWSLFVFGFAVGCNAIVGLRDIDEATASLPADGGAGSRGGDRTDAANASTDGGAPLDDGGTPDAAATTATGVLHFLETPASLTLSAGAGSIDLTDNGSFRVPVPAGGAYEVVVTAQPAGQDCWVTHGSGNGSAPTPGLEVRCRVVKTSSGTATTTRQTTSATYEPLDDVADIVFQNDVPARTLLYVAVPTINTNTTTNLASQHRVGIFVDGSLQAEAVTRVHYASFWNDTPVLVVATPLLPSGKHTVSARWRRVDQSDTLLRAALSPSNGPLRSELGVVVLDSLATFDRVESSSSTTPSTAAAFSVDTSLGIPPLTFTAAASQPSLLFASVPDFQYTGITKLQIDGATAASHRYVDNHFLPGTGAPPVPMVMRSLTEGPHTLDALINGTPNSHGTTPSYGTNAGSNVFKPAVLAALLWKPGTAFAAFESGSGFENTTMTANVFTRAGNAIDITTSKPGKALVMMDVSQLVAVNAQGDENPGEAAIFVGGAQGPTLVAGRGGWGDGLRTNVATRIGIVDLPAGKTTVDLRVRDYSGIRAAATALRFGVVALD